MTTVDIRPVTSLRVWVPGRPAPKGSHKLGAQGQLRNASAYLAAWSGSWSGTGRNRRRVAGAVERAVYERYHEMGLDPASLPLFRGPIGVRITFVQHTAPEDKPDGDKLERATWDALTIARVWEDDSHVVDWGGSKRCPVDDEGTGAAIRVWAVIP